MASAKRGTAGAPERTPPGNWDHSYAQGSQPKPQGRGEEADPVPKGDRRSLSDRPEDHEYSYGQRYGRHELGREGEQAPSQGGDSFGFGGDDLDPGVGTGGTGEVIVHNADKKPRGDRRKP